MRGIRAAATAVALLAVGCSVILNTAEPTQCSTTADCEANPVFRQRECKEGFCVVPGFDRNLTKPDGGDAGAPCVSTAQCSSAHGGEIWHCSGNGGVCIPWQTNECKWVGGGDAWKDENAIIIGAIQPYSVKQASGLFATVPYAYRVQQAINMAVEEIAAVQPAGIVPPESPPRPIAVLHCDSSAVPAKAQAIFDHLTGVVGAKAVIVGSDEDLAAVASRAHTSGTAIVCNDCVGSFPAQPLAWRIIPPAALQAPMAAWRVGVLEAQRKAEPNPPPTFKVAVLRAPEVPSKELTDQFTALAKFNGLNAGAQINTNYLVEVTEDPRKVDVQTGPHSQAIADFRPDVIMVALGDDFENHYLGEIETAWPADKPKPYYIVTEFNYDEGKFDKLLNANDELRQRISGTCNATTPALQSNIQSFKDRFVTRYNKTDPSGNWSGYEAAYALIYAMRAASLGGDLRDAMAGAAISDGFKRLLGGNPINVGNEQIGGAFNTLGDPSQTINLRGLWSELDWDPVTRDLAGDVGMYCFQNAGGKIRIKPDAGPRLPKGGTTVMNSYACD